MAHGPKVGALDAASSKAQGHRRRQRATQVLGIPFEGLDVGVELAHGSQIRGSGGIPWEGSIISLQKLDGAPLIANEQIEQILSNRMFQFHLNAFLVRRMHHLDYSPREVCDICSEKTCVLRNSNDKAATCRIGENLNIHRSIV